MTIDERKECFIRKAIEKWGDLYDYSNVRYVNARNPKHRSACKYFCQRSLLDESFEKLSRVYNSIIKELMLDSDKGSGDVDEL